MQKSYLFFALFFIIILSACNMPSASTVDFPEGFTLGTWNCTYMENGAYASLPLHLNKDGTGDFQYQSGSWTFDAASGTFHFSNMAVQSAVFSIETRTLELTLPPGQTVGGNTGLSCAAPQ